MTLTKNLIFLCLLCLDSTLLAQTPNESEVFHCPSDEMLETLLQKNTSYKKTQENYEKSYQSYLKNPQNLAKKSDEVYYIPVVVHILSSDTPLSTAYDLSDELIQNSIEGANNLLRHQQLNAETYDNPFYGVDTKIQLCLVTMDSTGNPTTGIHRYSNTGELPPFTYGTFVEDTRWNTDLYLNMYIAEYVGNNVAGYYSPSKDITAYLASHFTPYLIAHEVGHYFSLAHTFSGYCTNNDCTQDGDKVCDTPPKGTTGYTFQEGYSYNQACDYPGNSCTSDEDDTSSNNPYRSVSMGGMGDQPDMLDNYMDYTRSCRNSFTEGQKTRMRFNIETERPLLANNQATCSLVADAESDIQLDYFYKLGYRKCDPENRFRLRFSNQGNEPITEFNIYTYLNGELVLTDKWQGLLNPGSDASYALSQPVTMNEWGEHYVKVILELPNVATESLHNNNYFLNVEYLENCIEYEACADMNPNSYMGSGNTTAVHINANFPTVNIDNSITGIEICFTFQSNIEMGDDVVRKFDIYNESGDTTNIYTTANNGSCASPSTIVCFSPSIREYLTWVRDDQQITFTFDPIHPYPEPICDVNEVCAKIVLGRNCNSGNVNAEIRNPIFNFENCEENSVSLSSSCKGDCTWSTGENADIITVEETGWIYLTATDGDDCIDVDSVYIAANNSTQNSLCWEHINSAPAIVNAFAQKGNTLYAGTDNGLFSKTIGATYWEEVTAFPNEDQVIDIFIKGEKIMIYGRSKTYIKDASYNSVEGTYKIYVSSDNAETFASTYTKDYRNISGTRGSYITFDAYIQELSDDIYYLPSCALIRGRHDDISDIENHYTLDGGLTWDSLPAPAFSHATTDGQGTYFVSRSDSIFISDDPAFSSYDGEAIPMEGAYVYTGEADLVRSKSIVIGLEYKDDRLYQFYQDTLLISADRGATWQGQALPVQLSGLSYNQVYPNKDLGQNKPFKRLEDGYFYLYGLNEIYRTTDPFNQTWTIFVNDTDLPANNNLVGYNGFSKLDAGYFFTINGLPIFHSTDSGNTWQQDNWQGKWYSPSTLIDKEDTIEMYYASGLYTSDYPVQDWQYLPNESHDYTVNNTTRDTALIQSIDTDYFKTIIYSYSDYYYPLQVSNAFQYNDFILAEIVSFTYALFGFTATHYYFLSNNNGQDWYYVGMPKDTRVQVSHDNELYAAGNRGVWRITYSDIANQVLGENPIPTCINDNNDFEQGQAHWANFGNFAVDCSDNLIGCVAKVGPWEGGFGMAQSMVVTPNSSITISAVAKVDLPSNDANIGIKFLDANYAELYQEQTRITSNVYQSYTLTATVPSNASFAYAYAYKTDTDNHLYIDQLCWQEEEIEIVGHPVENQNCDNQNSTFEEYQSHWANFGSFSVDCNDSSVGCVGKVAWNEGGFGMAQSLAVTPNTSITISAIAKVDLPTNDANIGIKFLDANYGELYQEQERITSDVYQSYTLTTTVPSNASFAYAYAYKTDIGNDFYVDQLCLQTENDFDNNPQFRLRRTATTLMANVYPNPFKEEIRIELDLPKTSQLTIALVNTLGQTVKTISQTWSAGQQQLEIASSNLPSGTYYLQIRTSDDLLTKKLVKL